MESSRIVCDNWNQFSVVILFLRQRMWLMAITREQKKIYNEKIKPYKGRLDELKKKISTTKTAARKKPSLDAYFRVHSAAVGVQVANLLVMMANLSQKIQSLKNDGFLNDARKELSNLLSDLLKIVGEDIEGTLTENREKLAQLSHLTPRETLQLLKAIKESIDGVKDAMGANSKWRWYFPDLYYKLAVLSRNLFDFRAFEKSKNPSEEYFRERHEHLRFVVQESHNAAQEYRSRYELSTREVSDLEMIRRLFEMMKKIYVFTGNRDEVQKITTSMDAINEKIELLMAEKQKKKKT